MRRFVPTLDSVAARCLALVFAAVLVGCGGDSQGGSAGGGTTPPPTSGQTVLVGDTVALTASGKLISFNRAAPATLVGSITLSGLNTGETLLGIGFRPLDAQLYAVGSLGGVYAVVPSTGIAKFKAALHAAIGDNHAFTKLDGTRFAVGYDPVIDKLRMVSDTGQNLHVNVGTGSAVTDTAINGAPAKVAAIAYTNALPAPSVTAMYDIDAVSGQLYAQNVPNNGTLSAPVPLGVVYTAVGGLDIDARNNVAYAALTVGGTTSLYTVPLVAGGSAASVGPIGSGEALLGLALVQPTVVHVVALQADGATLLLFDAAAPNTITATLAIAGLDSGETVLGFDYRPSDGKLYGLTSGARIVVLDTTTGAAAPISTLAADATDDTLPYTGLVGTHFSVDFDPVADRLRVVSDSGANLHIDVDTGVVVTDIDVTAEQYGERRVVLAAAYANNFAGSVSGALYDIVTNGSGLVAQSPADDGTLSDDTHSLSVDPSPGIAMDIAGGDNGLVFVAAPIGDGMPSSLLSVPLDPSRSVSFGGGVRYRVPDFDNIPASLIGGEQGPAIIDIAIKLE